MSAAAPTSREGCARTVPLRGRLPVSRPTGALHGASRALTAPNFADNHSAVGPVAALDHHAALIQRSRHVELLFKPRTTYRALKLG
jgi:hypothetical protein